MDIYDAAREVATKFNLNENWLNDGVKGFISSNNNVESYLSLSNLIVKVAQLDYIFAMKVLSSRTDTDRDFNDLIMLIKLLNLKDIDNCMSLVDLYYDRKYIQPKSCYFLQNALELAWKEEHL